MVSLPYLWFFDNMIDYRSAELCSLSLTLVLECQVVLSDNRLICIWYTILCWARMGWSNNTREGYIPTRVISMVVFGWKYPIHHIIRRIIYKCTFSWLNYMRASIHAHELVVWKFVIIYITSMTSIRVHEFYNDHP